jgi:hypothetical protein
MRLVVLGLTILLVIGVCSLDTSIDHRSRPTSDKDSVLIALAGQFRVVFANLLWIKLDSYHHEFLAHNKDWTKNTDAVGLSRLITKLDPHFEEAYATGERMLIGMGKTKEAEAYLQEGVDNNPNSLMLHDEMGTISAIYTRDYKASLFHFKRAYILAGNDQWERRRLGKLIKSVEKLSKTKYRYTPPT